MDLWTEAVFTGLLYQIITIICDNLYDTSVEKIVENNNSAFWILI
jgi:hypothetical protein